MTEVTFSQRVPGYQSPLLFRICFFKNELWLVCSGGGHVVASAHDRVWLRVRLQVPGGCKHGSWCGSQGICLQRRRVTRRAAAGSRGRGRAFPPAASAAACVAGDRQVPVRVTSLLVAGTARSLLCHHCVALLVCLHVERWRGRTTRPPAQRGVGSAEHGGARVCAVGQEGCARGCAEKALSDSGKLSHRGRLAR